jgi:hypothetical protein
MTWTYIGLQELAAAIKEYEAELAERLQRADSDVSAQKVLNEIRAWREFNDAIKVIESRGQDPEEIFPLLRIGRRRLRNYRLFKKSPFTLIYRRDPVLMTAMPVLVYHKRDRLKRIQEMIRLLEDS